MPRLVPALLAPSALVLAGLVVSAPGTQVTAAPAAVVQVHAAVHRDTSLPLRQLHTPWTRSYGEGDEVLRERGVVPAHDVRRRMPLQWALGVGAAASGSEADAGEDPDRAAAEDPDRAEGEQTDVGEGPVDKHGHESHDRVDDFVLPHGTAPVRRDRVRQSAVGPRAVMAAASSFEGIGAGMSGYSPLYEPPDNNIAVGPDRIVEMVNVHTAVFDKSGTLVYGPVANNTFFSGFGGPCESDNDGDPIVQYDAQANRWLISQFANTASSYGPWLECVAVSTTGDPTGSYYRYAFSYSEFPDYPKVSIWPDAYYVTYNLFTAGSFDYDGGEVCALDRSQMLQGLPATQQCRNTGTAYGGLLAGDVDSTVQPPAAEPDLVVGLTSSSNTISGWRFKPDFATPADTTFTGPISIAVAPYGSATCGFADCVVEKGTTDELQTLGDRMMYRLAYRNFGDHESFVATHTVTTPSGMGVRWYELRPSTTAVGSTPAVYQQGTYAPDPTDGGSVYRWVPSIAQDRRGDIGLGFSESGSADYPSVHFTGRAVDDPAGTMPQGEGTLQDGLGYQPRGSLSRNRWGDYTALRVDPADQCTFWYVNQYQGNNTNFSWHTRIGSFRVPGCLGASEDFSFAATPFQATVTAGASRSSRIGTAVVTGSPGPLHFTVSGLPSGATASFTPSHPTPGTASKLLVQTSTTTPVGSYPVQITASDGTQSHTASYTLSVTPAPPTLSVGDVEVRENAGNAVFTVTRHGDTSGTAAVEVATSDDTATAGSDYTALPPTEVDFPAGSTEQTVSVPLLDDHAHEGTEAFDLNLTDAAGATVEDGTAVATIDDDDAPADLTVDDATLVEGNTGTVVMKFVVRRYGNSSQPASASYTTSGGTATAGSDYVATSGTVGFAAGQTTATVPVTIKRETTPERDETFNLVLSAPVGATLSDTTAVGTIVNDDRPSWLEVSDVSTKEGDSGNHTATFTVYRYGTTAGSASVKVATANGTATAGSDYVAVPPTTISFGPGEISKTVGVTVAGDTSDEPNETFQLRLSGAVGAVVSDSTGTGTIVDDDPRTTTLGHTTFVGVRDALVTESAGHAAVVVRRTGVTSGTSSVTLTTADGTATAGSDYTATSQTVTFDPGQSTKTVNVPVTQDAVDEPNETVRLQLSGVHGATISDSSGTLTIVDDDAPATLSLDDVTTPEGNSGSHAVTVTVRRGGNAAAPASVVVATGGGTATAGSDYTALAPTTVSFPAGARTATVTVPVLGDRLDEPDETIGVRLSGATGARVVDPTGSITVTDDDGPAYIAVDDVVANEGDAGSTTARFLIHRTGNLTGATQLSYATGDGSATSGSDYTAVGPQVLTFAAGQATKVVTVTVRDDAVPEPTETFTLVVSDVSGGVASDDQGQAKILDDD